MSAAAAVIVGGTALNMYGNMKASNAQAGALRQNADYYDAQASYIESVGRRKLSLLKDEQKQFFGRQKSMFAKAGIGFGGSALDVLAGTQVSQELEARSVENETAANASLARMRASGARDQANQLGDPLNQFISGAGTFLSGASRFV